MDEAQQRQVTQTTHGYGSQKHNALADPKKEEQKPQSLAQPASNSTQSLAATNEKTWAEKVEDKMYDTSEVDNFNDLENRAVEGQLDGQKLTDTIGKPLVKEIRMDVHGTVPKWGTKWYGKRRQ